MASVYKRALLFGAPVILAAIFMVILFGLRRGGPQEAPQEQGASRVAASSPGPPATIQRYEGVRPNVLMIAFDTVRADRMSSYGGPRPTTPNLDALAARGARFADCTAQAPFTPHSFSSMLSSLHVADLPVRVRARPEGQSPVTRAGLEEFHVTLPEVMREAGYLTGGVLQGWFTESFGLTQGYDWISYEPRSRLTHVVDESIRFLRGWKRADTQKPFFLFSYSFDVHYPFMEDRPADAHLFGGDPDGFNISREVLSPFRQGKIHPSQDDLDNALTLYDEGLHWADREIQLLMDELTELGVADSTIVVFVSDHGEEFGEHGYLSHGQSNFKTQVEVPLIIADPRLAGGRTVTTPVMNLDVMPTLLELCDIPIPETVKGLSLAPSLRGELQPELESRFIVSEGAWNGFVGGVRAGEFSFLLDEDKRPFLFNLSSDPTESLDLADELPELGRRLRSVLMKHKRTGLATQLLLLQGASLELDRHALPVVDEDFFATLGRHEAGEATLSEEMIRRLEALGYLN